MIHAHLIDTPIPIFYIKTIPTLPFGSLKENETKIQKSENDRLSFSWNYSVYCEVGYSLNMS